MLARRYELKFPLTIEQKDEMVALARHALKADAHGVDACYRVSSQYFDSRGYGNYWEKVEGERVRRKYRLRYYSARPDETPSVGNAYMEIKHRINNTVFKQRVRVTDEGAEAILSDASELAELRRWVPEEDLHKADTIEQVQREAQLDGFHAVHVITYKREAWEGVVDGRLRLTFDTDCRALPPSCFVDVGSDAGASILAPDCTIAEVKFDHAIPRWMRDTIVRLGLKSRRFSKYARGVEALGLCQSVS